MARVRVMGLWLCVTSFGLWAMWAMGYGLWL